MSVSTVSPCNRCSFQMALGTACSCACAQAALVLGALKSERNKFRAAHIPGKIFL